MSRNSGKLRKIIFAAVYLIFVSLFACVPFPAFAGSPSMRIAFDFTTGRPIFDMIKLDSASGLIALFPDDKLVAYRNGMLVTYNISKDEYKRYVICNDRIKETKVFNTGFLSPPVGADIDPAGLSFDGNHLCFVWSFAREPGVFNSALLDLPEGKTYFHDHYGELSPFCYFLTGNDSYTVVQAQTTLRDVENFILYFEDFEKTINPFKNIEIESNKLNIAKIEANDNELNYGSISYGMKGARISSCGIIRHLADENSILLFKRNGKDKEYLFPIPSENNPCVHFYGFSEDSRYLKVTVTHTNGTNAYNKHFLIDTKNEVAYNLMTETDKTPKWFREIAQDPDTPSCFGYLPRLLDDFMFDETRNLLVLSMKETVMLADDTSEIENHKYGTRFATYIIKFDLAMVDKGKLEASKAKRLPDTFKK